MEYQLNLVPKCNLTEWQLLSITCICICVLLHNYEWSKTLCGQSTFFMCTSSELIMQVYAFAATK